MWVEQGGYGLEIWSWSIEVLHNGNIKIKPNYMDSEDLALLTTRWTGGFLTVLVF